MNHSHPIESSARFRTLDLTYIALFAVLITVCSWVSIFVSSVPFTLQTFAVFAALGMLGGRRGTYAVLVYLLLGAVGLPVFAGFKGGLGALFGTTGGYILGFLGSALVFWLPTHLLGNPLPVTVFARLVGVLFCCAFGIAWFVVVYTRANGPISVSAALGWCVIPYIVPDLCKMALALGMSRSLKKYIK